MFHLITFCHKCQYNHINAITKNIQKSKVKYFTSLWSSHDLWCYRTWSPFVSGNGLWTVWQQATTWNYDIWFSAWPLGTNLCGIVMQIRYSEFRKMYLKISSGRYRPCCSGRSALIYPEKTASVPPGHQLLLLYLSYLPLFNWLSTKPHVLFLGNIIITYTVCPHYSDVIMGPMTSQITGVLIDYSTVWSGADLRRYQSFASLAFCREFTGDRGEFPAQWPVTQKMFPFDDVIMP